MSTWLPLLLVTACGRPEPSPPADQAVRVSMVLRGHHPSAEELADLRSETRTLDQLAQDWVSGPAFAETVADWHAQMLLLRHDTTNLLPPIGALEGVGGQAMADAMTEGPLRLIAHHVSQGTPYDAWFTGRMVAVDPVTAKMWGLDHEPEGAHWQISEWPPQVPAAGILADSTLWMRHISSDTNHHRTRANFVHTTWLCEDLAQRTLDLGELDLSDPVAVSDALNNDPACIGCHETLDPIASAFAGFDRYILPAEIEDAHEAGCVEDDPFCYPLNLYRPAQVPSHQDMALPPPGLAGVPVADLEGLAEALVSDSRFAPCVTRRWLSWSRQQPIHTLDPDEVSTLAAQFVDSGHDLATLALASTSDGRLDPLPAQHMRPEAISRDIARLTGFVWWADPDGGTCTEQPCWGPVNLGTSARWGLRELAGGIDAQASREPVHGSSAMGHLAVARLSELAADHVVRADFAKPAISRLLLREIEVDTADEDAVTAQIVALHQRILGDVPEEGDSGVQATLELWQTIQRQTGEATTAWTMVIAALLQSPERRIY